MADVLGTSGDDFLIGGSGDDVINTFAGNDVIAATQGHDTVDGGDGFDNLNVRLGIVDRFPAATAARTYTITAGHVGDSAGVLNTDFSNIERLWIDTVGNGNFNDTIDASGYTSANTGFGALRLTLGNGNNMVTGSVMSDWINSGTGSNTINAGGGYDEVYLNFSNAASSTLVVTGSGGTLTTSINGVTNTVTGAELIGVIPSTFVADSTTVDASGLTGFTGQFVFYDNNGSNIDIGSAGTDIFANVTGATAGHDVYTGNGGADTYDYTYAIDAMNGDTITDFDSDDVIDLRFNNHEPGTGPLAANSFIGTEAFSGTAGQYRYYFSGGQTFIEVDTDGDGEGDHSLNITNGQFQLVETAPGSNILKMGSAPVTGTVADETVTGTTGDDLIYGLAGADTINGDAGNDYIVGGDGNDTISGGSGEDVAAFVLPEGLAGTLGFVAGTGDNEGKYIVQRTDGSTVEDLFVVTLNGPGSATVQGINSAASLGTDVLTSVEEIQFRLDGGSDPARFLSGQIGVMQQGGAGHAVNGTIFDDVINLANYSGALQVFAQEGNDNITGTAASEYFEAGDGNDTVFAGSGNDYIDGGAGNDNLQGGNGDDIIDGGEGDDTLNSGVGTDILHGGAGYDIAFLYADMHLSDHLYVTGEGGNAFVTQGDVVTKQTTDVEQLRVRLVGVATGATFTTDASGYVSVPTTTLSLGDHNGTDVMIGSHGSDMFLNFAANVIGNDVFTGNGGADIFYYNQTVTGMNGDTITDFDGDDVIDLQNNNLLTNGGGLAYLFIGSAAFSGTAGQYRYYVSGGKTFLEADSNGDGTADYTLTLSNGQFELVETAPGSNILKVGRAAFQGTANGEFLIGTMGDDLVSAYDGNDSIGATQGHDTVDGGNGSDILNIRMSFTDRFAAATGARTYTITGAHVGDSSGVLNTDISNVERVWLDTVGAGNFNDTIDASGFTSTNTTSWLDGPGALRITLGNGSNTVIGSALSDLVVTGLGSNSINTGGGFDRVDVYFNNAAGSTLTVSGSGGTVLTSIDGVGNSVANAEWIGLVGSVTAQGTTTINASGLTGYTGVLVYYDNNGSNIDIGSTGTDIFANVTGATAGHDVYTGNGGADTYDYTYAIDAMNGDTITDFDSDDVIDLRFNNLEAGGSPLVANHFIGSAAFSGVAGEYRYYVAGGQTFLEVDTNGDKVGDHSLNIGNGQFELVETAPGSNILKMGRPAISGTSGVDTLVSTAGDNVIFGLGGNDIIVGSTGRDFVDGGAGNDQLQLHIGDANLFTPATAARAYTITTGHVGAGSGLVNTDFTNVERVWLDTSGSNFNDTIDASGYTSAYTGFAGLRVTLGNGNNMLTGSAMSDWIWTGFGSNTVNTGGGYDEVYAYFNNNTTSTVVVTGSNGTVITSVDGAVNTITNAEFVGVVGSLDGKVGSANNAVTTTVDASGLTGFNGQFVFWDTNGSNIDIGSQGADVFSNVTGATAGHDVYTGNGGADVYDYTYAIDAMNGDTITDFDADDSIDLRFNNHETGGSPLLANHFIGTAEFSGVAGEYRYYISGGQTFVEVDTDGDKVGDHSLNISNGQFELLETAAGSNILVRGQAITATEGNDTLTGTEGADTIDGLGGNDLIYGLGGNDMLTGGAGNDTLDGGGGNDTLIGGAGADIFRGGEGVDTALYTGATHLDLLNPDQSVGDASGDSFDSVEIIQLSAFDDYFGGSNFDDFITLGGGNDVAEGRGGNDSIFGGDGNDILDGGSGNDTLFGGAGADIFRGGDGVDTAMYVTATHLDLLNPTQSSADAVGDSFDSVEIIQLSASDDYFGGSNFDDFITLGDGNDVADGRDGNDSMFGGDGNDVLDGGAGNDTLFGGAGADVFRGGDGIDTAYYAVSTSLDLFDTSHSSGDAIGDSFDSIEIIRMSDFNDQVGGSIYDDFVSLGGGDDIADGHRGNDSIFGEGGDDLLSGGAGDDLLHGGSGSDTAMYLFASGGVLVDLDSGHSTAFYGDAGNDTLLDIENARGSAFNDVLIGTNIVNSLDGGAGDDILFGQADGDVLTGGSGADRFLYVSQYDSPIESFDRITDFETGIDKIDLRQAAAGRSVAWTTTTSGTDTILSIDFGSDGSIDMKIALSGNKTIVASDLMVSNAMSAAPLADGAGEAAHVGLLGASASLDHIG